MAFHNIPPNGFPDIPDMEELEAVVKDVATLKSGLISDKYTIGYTVKNMLSYPYSETTKTVNDVTFTVADDGKIAVNGTASARATFLIKDATSNFALPSGSYILTKGLVQSGFGITVEAYNGNSWVKLLAISAGADAANFTVDYVGYDRLVITAYVDNGIKVTNKTLSPMIRLSSVQDETWEAYSQTVAESLNTKQNATDNNLQTTDKTIVGGINELRNGLTNLIKSNTLTLTTGNGGHANTPIPDTAKVLQVMANGSPCLAFTYNGFWYFAVLTWDASTLQLALKPNAETTFTYYYV